VGDRRSERDHQTTRRPDYGIRGLAIGDSTANRLLFCRERNGIIEQIKALPPNERAQVAKFVVENDDSWIPESFKEGMADAEAGRFVDLDTALTKPHPSD